MSKAHPAERAATGSGAVGFNTKEHKERLSGLYRNTKIFRSSRAHGAATGRDDGVRRWGAAMGLGMGCGMQGRAPRRWRGGAMGTSRPMATVHGRRARQRDEVWGGEARGAGRCVAMSFQEGGIAVYCVCFNRKRKPDFDPCDEKKKQPQFFAGTCLGDGRTIHIFSAFRSVSKASARIWRGAVLVVERRYARQSAHRTPA